ncbi:MAG: hypothetical protein ACE5F1_05925 [Planctomycetota bacterium]
MGKQVVKARRFRIEGVSLLVILGFSAWESMHPSPGTLTAVHAREPELRGSSGCNGCHGNENQTMAEACIRCHVEIAIQLKNGTGLHGQLEERESRRCYLCHQEHQDPGFQIVGLRSFKHIGVENPERFEHRGLGFRLLGRHLRIACEDCHPAAKLDPLPRGSKRFLGLEQRCTACHDDPHDGSFTNKCKDCHGEEEAFENVAVFRHRPDFPLTGGHGGRGCEACHPKGSSCSVEALFTDELLPSRPVSRRCNDCHENPHLGPDSLYFFESDDCQRCHDSIAFADLEFGPEAHEAIGVELQGSHLDAACRDCHRPDRAPPEAGDVPAMTRCAACHANPHVPPLAGGPEGSIPLGDTGSCGKCHGSASFNPAEVWSDDHADLSFELLGPHAESSCEDCHGGRDRNSRWAEIARLSSSVLGYRSPYPKRQEDCLGCHLNPHDPAFTGDAAAWLDVAREQSCLICHEADHESFVPPPGGLSPELHALSGFPLTRPHDRVACLECHAEAPERESDPARRALALRGRPRSRRADNCRVCHEDPHEGQFDTGAFAGENCLACHDRYAFEPPDFSLEHHLKTRFPLVGAHVAVACVTCHERPETGEATSARIFRGTARDCEDCHEDVHEQRFDRPGLPAEIEGRRGCARCHWSESFDEIRPRSFDHGRWTDFPLRGEHAGQDCEACHPRSDEPDIWLRSFGRARASCSDCHEDPHLGQFVILGRTECQRCHVDGKSFTELAFDHRRDARFALDESHARLACSSCHKPVLLSEGRKVIRYKPLGVRCGDCHDSRTAESDHGRGGSR